MAIEKLIWRDEEIAPIQGDYEPRYDLTDHNGQTIAVAAKLRLVNEVRVEGTLHNADNMNKLFQKSDAVGSFFYRPLAGVPLLDFPHPAIATGWHALPDCPIDTGARPVVCTHGGKFYVTLGRAENALSYDVAVYDTAAARWDVHNVENSRPVSLGGAEDWRIIGNRLFVCGKDWDGIGPATAWMDVLDLDEMRWTHGATNTWAAHLRTIGPMCLSADGSHAVIAGRDGTQGNGTMERITLVSTAPVTGGMLPQMAGIGTNYVPSGIAVANGQHILCLPNGQVTRSTQLVGWQGVAVPALGQGALRPVAGGDGSLLAFTAAVPTPNLFHMSLDGDMAISAKTTERPPFAQMVTTGVGRCYFMLSAAEQEQEQEASASWRLFDTNGNKSAKLADAPEILTARALCAAADGVFAIKGKAAHFGYFGDITQGVVAGRTFRGLSVSASGSLFLVNSRETIAVSQGVWHECADDYLICVAGGTQIFGQIANL